MILIKTWWRTKWGKGSATLDVLKQMDELLGSGGNSRFLTDLSGEFFTVVWEREAASLSEMEKQMETVMGRPEYSQLMAKMGELVVTGGREIYRIR